MPQMNLLSSTARRAAGLMLAAGLAVSLAACKDDEKKAEAAPAATQQTAETKPAETKPVEAAKPAETTAAETKPAAAETKPAVEIPSPDATIDLAKLLEAGALPEMELGNPQAKVTVIEYASMTCGHCAAFHGSTFKAIEEKYIKTGQIRFIFREYPFDALAEAGFLLARCNEKVYFPMVSALFSAQSNWVRAEKPSEALFQISKQAGFTEESFNACLKNQEVLDKIRQVRTKGGEAYGVEATPTFFINGKKFSGNMSADVFSALIDAEM